MGADDAKAVDAATDGRGRVRGVEGLWVADASLMPTIPSANTNLTTIMMGERFGESMKSGDDVARAASGSAACSFTIQLCGVQASGWLRSPRCCSR